MRKMAIVPGLLILSLTAAPAAALQERERQDLRQQIRDVKSWELVRELGLDSQAAREFVPLYEDYDRARTRHRQERRGLEQALEVLVKDSSRNGDQIRSVMADMRRLDERLQAEEGAFRRQAFPLLSLEQQARFELFEKRFNARLREMIKDIREERGPDTARPKDSKPKSRSHGRAGGR
ncbi:hypothetical protein FJ251_02455 [bacterium]|nr:hypothetical protein [bacterium]